MITLFATITVKMPQTPPQQRRGGL